MYNEHLTDYIEGHFKECLKPGISFVPEYYPHIPGKHLEKAVKHFLKTEREDETVLMLFDTSLFSKGKNGLAITDQAVYFKDMFGGTQSVRFRGWRAGKDETEQLLKISNENPMILSPFLDKLIAEICTIKTYEGLFEQEDAEMKAAEEKAAEEAKAAEEKAAEEKAAEEAKIAEEKAAKEKAAEEARAAEEAAEEQAAGETAAETKAADAKAAEEKKSDEDDEDDEDDDDDESGGSLALQLLGAVISVASDPTYE